MADLFKDEFVPNIQTANKTNYSQWKNSNPGEAAKWEKFRDALYTYKKGDALAPPSLATKYGKALVAAGKQHMSVIDLGAAPINPPPPPPPPTGTVLYGVHQDLHYAYPDHTRRLDNAGQLRAQISRSSLSWSGVEGSQGNYNWAALDAIMAGLNSRGIKACWYPINAPQWASGYSDGVWIPSNATQYNFMVTRYADFCGRAAARYPGQYWEIWNEVNQGDFWKVDGGGPPSSVTQYVQMYNAARTAILAADSTAHVAAGSVAGVHNTGAPISGMQWFVNMKNAGATITAAGIHPYDDMHSTGGAAVWAPDVDEPGAFNAEFTDIARTKTLFDANGMSAVKLWVTEYGWDTNRWGDSTVGGWVSTSLDMIKNTYTYVDVATYFLDMDVLAPYDHWGLSTNANPCVLKQSGTSFRDWVTANG